MPSKSQTSGLYKPLTTQKSIGSRSSQKSQIQHIILTLIDSGLAVFHQAFSNEIIEPDLFSALATATSLRKKLHGDFEKISDNQIFQVEHYTANMCYGRYLAGIVLSDAPLEAKPMVRIKKFIMTFEDEYEFLLINWHGDISFFDQDWASTLLDQYLSPLELIYRLHSDAMNRSENGRQIRIILLIKRFVGKSDFNLEALARLIIEELQIPENHAESFLSNLEKQGIIIPRDNPI